MVVRREVGGVVVVVDGGGREIAEWVVWMNFWEIAEWVWGGGEMEF